MACSSTSSKVTALPFGVMGFHRRKAPHPVIKPSPGGRGERKALGTPALRIDTPVHTRRAASVSHRVAHASRVRGGMFALLIPGRTVGHLVVLEFIHRGIAHLALDDAEAPRIDDAWHRTIPRDVLAVIPRIPL